VPDIRVMLLLSYQCWGLQGQFETGAAGTSYFEPGGAFLDEQ